MIRAVSKMLRVESRYRRTLQPSISLSTEFEQDLDPEEARAIVDPALKLMIDAVRRYDGYIVQSTGDGIVALFGAPVAHEDHPQLARQASIALSDSRLRGRTFQPHRKSDLFAL